ncbi:CPBP family intramembrane glutamic endopeptidase [Nocardiopsis sp. NPDC055551]
MKLFLQLLAVMVAGVVGGQAVMLVEGDPWLTLGLGLLTAVLTLALYRWVLRLTKDVTVTDVTREGVFAGLGGGTLVGVLLFACVIVNIAFLGHYKVDGMGSPTGAVGLFGFMAAAAVTEEVLFRGVLFRFIERGAGTWIAVVASSVLFGLWHLPNPNASLLGIAIITVGAGGLLAVAYVATRSLWLPIGIHFGWNFAASAIFSTEVSGNGTPAGLLDATTSGPLLITGGDFGPEASLYSLVFLVLATVVYLWVARRRRNLVPMRRSDRVAAATLTG